MRALTANAKVHLGIGNGTLVAHLAAMCQKRDWMDRAIAEFGESTHPGGSGSLNSGERPY